MTNDGYTTGEWNGLPNYQCDHCPFSTLSKAGIAQHMLLHFPPPPPPPPPVVPVFDRYGNEVRPHEVTDATTDIAGH